MASASSQVHFAIHHNVDMIIFIVLHNSAKKRKKVQTSSFLKRLKFFLINESYGDINRWTNLKCGGAVWIEFYKALSINLHLQRQNQIFILWCKKGGVPVCVDPYSLLSFWQDNVTLAAAAKAERIHISEDHRVPMSVCFLWTEQYFGLPPTLMLTLTPHM